MFNTFLNPFPEFLTYSLMGPFILRMVLGLIFLDLGLLKLKSEKSRWIASLEALHLHFAKHLVSIIGAIEIVGGIMLILGLWTQVAAIIFIIITSLEIYIEWKDSKILKRDFVFYILTLSIAASLLLTGAGAFALDMPL